MIRMTERKVRELNAMAPDRIIFGELVLRGQIRIKAFNVIEHLSNSTIDRIEDFLENEYTIEDRASSRVSLILIKNGFLRSKALQRIVALTKNLKFINETKICEGEEIEESDYVRYFNQLTETEREKIFQPFFLEQLPGNGQGLTALSNFLTKEQKKYFREDYLNNFRGFVTDGKKGRTLLIKANILVDKEIQKFYATTYRKYEILIREKSSYSDLKSFFDQLSSSERALLTGRLGYYTSGDCLPSYIRILTKEEVGKLGIPDRLLFNKHVLVFDLLFKDYEVYHKELESDDYYKVLNHDWARSGYSFDEIFNPLGSFYIKSPLLKKIVELQLAFNRDRELTLFSFLSELTERDKRILRHFLNLFVEKHELDITKMVLYDGIEKHPSIERSFKLVLADQIVLDHVLSFLTPSEYKSLIDKAIEDKLYNTQELLRLEKAGFDVERPAKLIELEQIFVSGGEIIPFLQKLRVKDKKVLTPYLKSDDWIKSLVRRGVKENEENVIKLSAVRFFCLGRRELDSLILNNRYNEGLVAIRLTQGMKLCLENIPSYYPKWLNKYVSDNFYDEDIIHFDDLLYFAEKELIQTDLTPYIVQRILPDLWGGYDGLPYSFYNDWDTDTKKIFFDKYFWLLFEFEPMLGQLEYTDFVLALLADKKIDRLRVLAESILATGRGFSVLNSKLFYDTFIALNPSGDELLAIQEELFEALTLSYAKVKIEILKLLKPLIANPAFNTALLLDNIPFVIQDESTSVVKATITFLKQLIKVHKNLSTEASFIIADLLSASNTKIQLQAAKFIDKHGSKENQELKEIIASHSKEMVKSTKDLLEDFLAVENSYKGVDKALLLHPLDKENRLDSSTDTFNDLLLKVNGAYNFREFCDYVIKLNVLVDEENVECLAPLFEKFLFGLDYRLEGSFREGSYWVSIDTQHVWRWQEQHMKHQFIILINYWSNILLQRYPQKLADFQSAIEVQKNKLLSYNKAKLLKGCRDSKEDAILERQKIQDIKNAEFIDRFFKENREIRDKELINLLEATKTILDKNLDVELLLSPTHKGGWIDPEIFIERILALEKNNVSINKYLFTNAMKNTFMQLDDSSKIARMETIQDFEIKQILQYHLGLLKLEDADIRRPVLWEPSVACYEIESEIQYLEESKMHKVDIHNAYYNAYQLNMSRGRIFEFERIGRVEFLGDNPLEYSVDFLINRIYQQKLLPIFYTDFSQRILSADKKVIIPTFAIQVWKKLVAIGNWDSCLLGKALANQAQTGYILRFVDNVNNHMIDLTEEHNKEIFTTIDTMIAYMDEKPKRGVKELLKTLNELQGRFPGESISEESKAKLSLWKETKTLKGTINKIEKLY